MKQTLALAWKECREQAWFVLAGLLIFLGMPMALGAAAYYSANNNYFWPPEGVGVVVGLGGAFAVFLAVAATCRDLSGQIYTFWRSRPIGLLRLLAVKYVVGLLILLLTTWAGLLFVMWTYLAAFPGNCWYHTGAFGIGLCHSPVLILIFSIAFLLGCLVRQAARAAMLGLLAAMLIYFLPLLLPSLARFSFFTIMDQRPWNDCGNMTQGQLEFMQRFWIPDIGWWRQVLVSLPLLLAGLIGSVAAFAAACTAAARGWRLRADKKALSWSLVIVVLGLMAAASVQVGSNMKCKASYTLAPPGTQGRFYVSAAYAGAQGGILVANRYERQRSDIGVCSFSVENSALRIGPFESLGRSSGPPWWPAFSCCWSPQDPQRLYCLRVEITTAYRREEVITELVTASLPPDSAAAVVHRLDLTPELTGDRVFELARAGQRLYIRTYNHLLTLDISNADAPRLVSNVRRGGEYQLYCLYQGATVQSLPLLPLEGLSVRERLAVTAALYWGTATALDGDLLVHVDGRDVDAYRLTIGQGEKVGAKWVGRYEPSPLEQLIKFYPRKVVARNGIAYLLDEGGSAMEAMDVRNPAAIRRIGHYRSGGQNFRDMALLGDGSILLAGTKVEIIAPVKVKD